MGRETVEWPFEVVCAPRTRAISHAISKLANEHLVYWRVRLLVCVAVVVTQTRLEEVRSNLGHSVRWRCASWRGGRLGLLERDLGVESALHGRSKVSSVVQSGKGRAEGFDMRASN